MPLVIVLLLAFLGGLVYQGRRETSSGEDGGLFGWDKERPEGPEKRVETDPELPNPALPNPELPPSGEWASEGKSWEAGGSIITIVGGKPTITGFASPDPNAGADITLAPSPSPGG